MSTTATSDYEFTCSQHGEGFAINSGMRVAVLERGCSIYGNPVSIDTFDPCPA